MKNAASSPKKTTATRKRQPATPTQQQILRTALAPYVNLRKLQHLAAHEPEEIHTALLTEQPPPEVQAIMQVLAAVLRPIEGEQITEPRHVAAALLVEMGLLTREELRVIYLSSRNYVQTIKTIAYGNFKEVSIRPIELFHEAARRNSFAIIMVHNHPTGDPTPSSEDLYLTRQMQELGDKLGVKVLDHMVIGRGRWVSIAEEYPAIMRHE
ncbi:MAG TPA: JAB domain-containing protein [Herpetosiphonaceae bacterium]